MSDSNKKPNFSEKIIDLLLNDVFKKNGINLDHVKQNISEQQREMMKEMVKDLSEKVDSFVNSSSPDTKKASKDN